MSASQSPAREEKKEELEDLSNPNVVTKYKKAAEIAHEALQLVLSLIAHDVSLYEITKASDDLIVDRTGKIYNNVKPKPVKGIGFPTCLSVNGAVGHVAPDAKSTLKLVKGQIVKIDLGVQLDGYVCLVAQTVSVPESAGQALAAPVSGRQADVMAAAIVAADAATRCMKVGNKNSTVTDIISKVAADYHVSPVQGVLSHELKRYTIDGAQVILNRGGEPEHKVDEFEFAPNQVYALDIVMSSGEGKPKELDTREANIYKRNTSATYSLKHKISRAVLSDIDHNFKHFPFNLRMLEDGAKARFGLLEAREHELVSSYPVLYEKDGEYVAQVKLTVFVQANGVTRLTQPQGGLELNTAVIQSQYKTLNEDVLKALQTSASSSAAKKKKKNKKKKSGDAKDAKDAESDGEGEAE